MGGFALLDAAWAGAFVVVGLPLLIHLLSRRRARRVAFAPIELLLRSQKRTARSIRLRQLLLLMVRTLLLATLASALVRPMVLKEPLQASTQSPIAVVVAVDVSASMHTSLDGRTAMARAKDKAREAITRLVGDVRIGLVACDAEPRDVIAPTFDRREVLGALDRLQAGYAFADIGVCVSRAAVLARTVTGATKTTATTTETTADRRIIVVSDLAAHGFARSSAGVDGSGMHVDVVAAFDEEPPPNHAVTDADLRPSPQGVSVRFHAVRFGGPEIEVGADLQVGERRAARLALPMSSGRLLERAFTATINPGDDDGIDQDDRIVAVVFDDDAFDVDNAIVLPREERSALKVLVVNGEADALPFADEVFYLTQALTSSRAARGGGRIAVTVTVPESLDAASLVGVDVIVLANVARLEKAAAAAVVSHVKAGAGLLATMGDQVDVDAWNEDLAEVLPATLRGAKGQALLDDASVAEVLGFTRFLTQHPALQALAGTGTEALPGLARVRTSTSMLVEPDSQTPREVLLRFTNDAPALLERSVGPEGKGRSILFATSVDREWTDLPIRPGFLPLVEQLVLYLGRALDDGRPRIVRVGESRAVRVPAATRAVVIVPPSGTERRVDVENGEREVVVTALETPGLHRVSAVDADGQRTPLPTERFSVMIDPRESDPTRIAPERMEDAFPTGAVVRRGGEENPGTPLWPFLLAAAAALVLWEGALLRRSSAA